MFYYYYYHIGLSSVRWQESSGSGASSRSAESPAAHRKSLANTCSLCCLLYGCYCYVVYYVMFVYVLFRCLLILLIYVVS